ncbi:hypothetical protein CPC08DRAFT_403980 [Agrocybe pediades]|nr:hypothetical protein CPC08DRAFT_403980 [Agrocybe pediades]
MQQPYASYPYYGPPMYPPSTPYMGPANPQAPQHGNPPAPTAYSFDAAAYAVKPPLQHGNSQPRAHRRNSTHPTAPQPQTPFPLKSAMKKTINVFSNAESTIGRQFSNPFNNASNPQRQSQAPTFPRPRVQSNPSKSQNSQKESPVDETSFHMMISFHNYNELHIEHIILVGLEEMRRVIWPMWPDGIESDSVSGHTCIVKFRNTPWDLSGPDVALTYKIITAIFHLFQSRGYSFQTLMNVASPSPRLLFQVTSPHEAEFFVVYFSQEGRKITLIDPPGRIELSTGAHLRAVLPNSYISEEVFGENNRIIEVKRKATSAPEIEQSVIFVQLLKILNNSNFNLDASIPLGRKGPLGIRYTRELLIFKGPMNATH